MNNESVKVPMPEGATVEITPELLAIAFWKMDTCQQADFFEALAKHITKDTPSAYGFGEMQWCYLQQELRRPGRELANNMHMALSAFAFDFWPQKISGARTGVY